MCSPRKSEPAKSIVITRSHTGRPSGGWINSLHTGTGHLEHRYAWKLDVIPCLIIFTGNSVSECAVAILESELEPRDEIIFLAKEMTHVADKGDERIVGMKTALSASLINMVYQGAEEQGLFEWDER